MGPALGRVALPSRRNLRVAIALTALIALTTLLLPGNGVSTLRAQEAASADPVPIDSIEVRGNQRLTDVQVISKNSSVYPTA